VLKIEGLHSYARIYLDGSLAGTMDRRLEQSELHIIARAGQVLGVLVENSGRINFTTAIRTERAGITGAMSLSGRALDAGDTVSLPLEEPPAAGYRRQECQGPCFYRGELDVDTPGDTYLNTEQLGKGVIWVNGHLLGRFWNIGPMGSVFLPGAWLHPGKNDVTVFDLNGGPSVMLRGDDHPTYLDPRPECVLPFSLASAAVRCGK
jgi:beta-galactosidase